MSLTNYRTLPREPQFHVVYTPLSAVCPCCGNKNKFIVVTEEAEDSNQLRKNSSTRQGSDVTVSLCTDVLFCPFTHLSWSSAMR